MGMGFAFNLARLDSSHFLCKLAWPWRFPSSNGQGNGSFLSASFYNIYICTERYFNSDMLVKRRAILDGVGENKK